MALAKELRWALREGAAEATSTLGELPSWIGNDEASVRVWAHDALYPHHDKDYRSMAAFPAPALRNVALHVFRVGYWGSLRTDVIYGPDFDEASGVHAWLLIHRQHARALHQSAPLDVASFAALSSSWAALHSVGFSVTGMSGRLLAPGAAESGTCTWMRMVS